jgi:CubicO group peptidase (beta-lactamase class C family)
MRLDSQLATASATKGFTALAAMSLVEEGRLSLSTTARSLLGDDLPLIADDVTVEHLLAHRSGIGDYLDESVHTDSSDYVLSRPVHELAETESFLPLLDGLPTVFPAGERFAYCNGGFVVLAVLLERASGESFHDLVRQRVCAPAGLADTDFLRSDALPGRAAVGYVKVGDSWRTNVLHLPVVGNGDGGIYTTVADVAQFWTALFDGRVVGPDTLREMVRPRSDVPEEGHRYGLGFWLDAAGDGVVLIGGDAGVSFLSRHDPTQLVTYTVIGNDADAAWPLVRVLRERLG